MIQTRKSPIIQYMYDCWHMMLDSKFSLIRIQNSLIKIYINSFLLKVCFVKEWVFRQTKYSDGYLSFLSFLKVYPGF